MSTGHDGTAGGAGRDERQRDTGGSPGSPETPQGGLDDGRPTDWQAALTVARFEGRQRLRMGGVIAALLSLVGAFYVWLGPQFTGGDGLQQLVEALPPAMVELFGFESLASIEGLLASEFYTFGWLVGFAGYLAYTTAGTVAGARETNRLDTLLAAPVARRSALLGKYLAILVPVAIVNVVVPLVLYLSSVAVGEPLAAERLLAVHLLSVPYLLCWAAVGLLLGVALDHGRTAGRLGLGLVFGAWILEAVLGTTDYEWATLVLPPRYFDTPAILVDATYDLVGAGLLLAVTGVVAAVSVAWFDRGDL